MVDRSSCAGNRREARPWCKRALAALLLAAGMVSGCATLPEATPRGTSGTALLPQLRGPLAGLEAKVTQRTGPDTSGFILLAANSDGLQWRLAAIDSAQVSLDLQYYTWWGDESGLLLMKRVVGAADRGVKVRLILDDLSTILEDETHPTLRDATAAMIDAHPNIEIRLFNVWRRRPLVGRALDTVEHMERVNHRMHNKLLIADNRLAILGGRNIGNEYFGLSRSFNFLDLDVAGVGPVARQSSAVFDRFWNSEWLVPVAALGQRASMEDLERADDPVRRRLDSAKALKDFPVNPQDWTSLLDAFAQQMHPGSSRVHADTPDPDALNHHMPGAIRDLLGSAQTEVLITNAYIIPGTHALERTRLQTERGVRVRMLTNSLASHDVPAVNSHYKQWRRPILEAGIELYEIRPDAAIKPILADTAPTVSEFMGLHVKAMVIDRQRVFIGSMNLDPRSWELNSEMGVVIESPGLARELALKMERDMEPENAWRVSLARDGSLRWIAGDTVLTSQPARSLWQRVEDVFFMAFPRDLY